MCGIIGRLDFGGARLADGWLGHACGLLAHRGPDGSATWEATSGAASVELGHRRLAVIDLADRAAQPMHNAACVAAGIASPLVVVFNGEIYNYRDLRVDLVGRGHHFTTASDTEVVLHAYEEFGTEVVERLRGMFAFAVWDTRRERLFCARDRVGKKPLYYRWDGGRFWFGSEARAILADPQVPRDLDDDAIAAYLGLGYVPGERSAFAALRRLPPAHTLTVDRSGCSLARYWRLQYEPKTSAPEPVLVDELEDVLAAAVRERLVSDVRLGAFLSGGIDSSLVVALAQSQLQEPLRTFTMGFDDPRYDELDEARVVARACGTEHHEHVVRPDALAVVPRLAWHYGEPYADSSAVPTYYLAQFARRHITVAITGDGGDESFAGYRRYRAHRWLLRYGSSVRPAAKLLAWTRPLLPAAAVSRSWLYDLDRLARHAADTPARRYAAWFGFFAGEDDMLQPGVRPAAGAAVLEQALASLGALAPVDQVMALDVSTYLPDDLLVKTDIATMAHGLEARSPLLDHRVMEFAAKLPTALKVRGGGGKYLLRKVVARRLPPDVLARPKKGFGVPLDSWFRGALGVAARDLLLSPGTLVRRFVRPDAIERMFQQQQTRQASHAHRLWALLMLETWNSTRLDQPLPVDADHAGSGDALSGPVAAHARVP